MANTQTVTVNLGERSYPIVIGHETLPRLGDTLAHATRGKLLGVVCDKSVWALHGKACEASLKAAGFRVVPCIIEPGEQSKRISTVEAILDNFLSAGFDRQSIVLGFGGGVVGDIAGFSAAVCLRGVRFIQVPTTVVAQVDASVGGKTGVDHPLGKNLIGAFHQPSLVFADTALLASLPQRELAAGMVEIVKHAVIRDKTLFSRLEKSLSGFLGSTASPEDWIELVAANCRIKAAVVSADEREAGLRAILNFGHTAGHAIEKLGQYERYRHGEAVAFGMMVAGRLASSRGLWKQEDEKRQRLLLNLLLDITPPLDFPAAEVWQAMQSDKKAQSGVLRFVLPAPLGNAAVVSDVTQHEFAQAWETIFPPTASRDA